MSMRIEVLRRIRKNITDDVEVSGYGTDDTHR